jgi:hypothetical protein
MEEGKWGYDNRKVQRRAFGGVLGTIRWRAQPDGATGVSASPARIV